MMSRWTFSAEQANEVAKMRQIMKQEEEEKSRHYGIDFAKDCLLPASLAAAPRFSWERVWPLRSQRRARSVPCQGVLQQRKRRECQTDPSHKKR